MLLWRAVSDHEAGEPRRAEVSQEAPALVPPPTPNNDGPPIAMPQARLSGSSAALIAWLLAAAVNGVLIELTVPRTQSLGSRLLHHAYDFGQFVALGLLCSALADSWRRWGSRRRGVELLAIALVSVLVGAMTLPADLENFGVRMGEWAPPSLITWVSVVFVSLGVPASWLVGRWMARPYLRLLPIVVALAALSANAFVLQYDYPGVHLYVALVSGTFMASALAGARLPGALGRPRAASTLRTIVARAALALICVGASVAVVVWPPRVVASELLRCSGSVLPPFLGRIRVSGLAANAGIPALALDEWYGNRAGMAPVPPSTPPLLPSNGVVILLSIDAVRADTLLSGKHASELPALTRLGAESVQFSEARAPGSQTVYTLSTVFAGTYFSQQYWTTAKFDKDGLWPHQDPSVRFPQLLADASIPTVTFSGAHWLFNRWGCVRGFTEETHIKPTKSYYAHAEPIMDALLARLGKVEDGPLFLYAHFLDPHAPYDLSPVKGSTQARWLGEVSMVDAQIGRLLDWIGASKIADRTALLVTADHGEAFGEHNSTTHATTLYDEVLRVPLMIRLPGAAPRSVAEPVSLVDLGPTVLDLMGRPTPSQFMGQSLVPFLRGQNPRLFRPILAEGRLKQSLVLPSGKKIIVDNLNGSVELYDLREDPEEKRNLADRPEVLEQPQALLRQFFAVHTIKRPDYKVPLRK